MTYKQTEEHRKKYTDSRRKNGWFKDLEKSRKKMSESHKRKYYPPAEKYMKKQREAWTGENNPMKNPTKKHLLNLSLSHIGKKQTAKWKEMRSKLVLPLQDSSIEVRLQNFLKELQIEFFTHQYMHIEHGYQCDILIPSKNLIIECFGDYWHKYPI